MLKITILWKERCHLLVDSVGLSLPLLYTLESLRVWFDVGGCGVVAYAGVVTLVGLAVGYPTVVILTTTGGWLPRSGGPNHNRVLAAPHHNACVAVVAGHPALISASTD